MRLLYPVVCLLLVGCGSRVVGANYVQQVNTVSLGLWYAGSDSEFHYFVDRRPFPINDDRVKIARPALDLTSVTNLHEIPHSSNANLWQLCPTANPELSGSGEQVRPKANERMAAKVD